MRPTAFGALGEYRDERATRNRLLDVTVGRATQLGLGAVTVRDVCAEAGLATRTFYRYFADVREAFFAASLALHRDLRATVDAAYDAHDTPTRRALACIDALIGFVCADPMRAEALFVEGPAGGVDIDSLRAETVEWAIGLVMGVRVHLPIAGHPWERPPDDTTYRLLAEMAVGGVNAMIWRQLVRGDLDPLVAATPYLVETVLRPYEWAQRYRGEGQSSAGA